MRPIARASSASTRPVPSGRQDPGDGLDDRLHPPPGLKARPQQELRMRLASVSGPSGSPLAARLDDGLYDLRAVESSLPDGVGPLLEAGLLERAGQAAKGATAKARLDQSALAYRPLVERPGKINFIWPNYAAHARAGRSRSPIRTSSCAGRRASSRTGRR